LKLRLHHHHDGARVAYREAGTGPAIVLVHSAMLTHREWEPVVEHLSDRFRVILPDLPLHGDSEDRPRHPYTLDWLAEVLAGFCAETAGARPLVGGHGLGAEILLRAVELGLLEPGKLVLAPTRTAPAGAAAGATASWRLARARRASRGSTAPSRTARAWPSAPTSA
jgi:pimeloyl-ACP methyl ester carboxylesterase